MDRETEEILCDLQAQLCAQRVALRALARAHPRPVEVLTAWRQALIEPASHSPVPAHARNSDYFNDQVRASVEDWTAELVELAVPSGETVARSSPG